MRIHAFFDRIIIKSDTCERKKIIILAIFCETAKRRGHQYTKRILPAFVIPECNVMLSNVMKYIKQCPQERINYDKAQTILGVDEPRILRKHILQGREIIDKTNLELTQILSRLPSFAHLAESKPGVGRHESLAATVGQIEGAVRRMHGADRQQVPAIEYVHVVYMFHRARNPVVSENLTTKSLGYILSNLVFNDTS